MLIHHSIALGNLSKTIPPIDEDQKVALLHAPFKDTTLFGGELAKLQKANMKHDSALTKFTAPAAPPPTYAPEPYTGRGKSFKRGSYSYKRGGWDKDHDKSTPLATVTKTPKSGTVRPPSYRFKWLHTIRI